MFSGGVEYGSVVSGINSEKKNARVLEFLLSLVTIVNKDSRAMIDLIFSGAYAKIKS